MGFMEKEEIGVSTVFSSVQINLKSTDMKEMVAEKVKTRSLVSIYWINDVT